MNDQWCNRKTERERDTRISSLNTQFVVIIQFLYAFTNHHLLWNWMRVRLGLCTYLLLPLVSSRVFFALVFGAWNFTVKLLEVTSFVRMHFHGMIRHTSSSSLCVLRLFCSLPALAWLLWWFSICSDRFFFAAIVDFFSAGTPWFSCILYSTHGVIHPVNINTFYTLSLPALPPPLNGFYSCGA